MVFLLLYFLSNRAGEEELSHFRCVLYPARWQNRATKGLIIIADEWVLSEYRIFSQQVKVKIGVSQRSS